jgi:hypothetical protein
MVDRVEALNGTLKLHRIEDGLELVGRIPLPQPEPDAELAESAAKPA